MTNERVPPSARGETPPGEQSPEESAPSHSASGDSVGDTLRILKNDPRRALERLEERVSSGNADYRTWHNLAVARANLGDLGGALEAVSTSLAENPNSDVTHFLQAKVLQEADRYQEALAVYDRVVELTPHFRKVFANRGVVRFFLDDFEGAVRDLEDATREDPSDAASLFNLAVVYVAARSFHHAERALGRLIALEPERASHYYQFLVELGRYQVIDETLTQSHRIKNFMGIVGDRLRRVCEGDLSGLESELQEDLLGVRDDYGQIYSDLVIFLRAIQLRPMRLQSADLRRLLDRVVFVAVDKARAVTVHREFPADLDLVQCDLDMMQEAFLNLLVNAMDAIEESGNANGEVTIRIEARGSDPALGSPATATASSPATPRPAAMDAVTLGASGSVIVTFQDNGCGIPPGDLGRIFGFGFTTKSLGTGIGLSFTRKVIEQHGGRVEVDSEPGRGTTIRCMLPTSPRISETLTNRALRVELFRDPRELILEEPGEDLGI